MAEPGIAVDDVLKPASQPTPSPAGIAIGDAYTPAKSPGYLGFRQDDHVAKKVSESFWESIASFVDVLEPAELLLRTGQDPRFTPKETFTKRLGGYFRTLKPHVEESTTIPGMVADVGLDVVGGLPAGVAGWMLGTPFAFAHGIESAKKIAKSEGREATAWEMGRNAVYETVARYMMGKAVQRDWGRLTNALFFGGTSSIVDLAEGKKAYETATNGALNFVMGFLGKNISPRERAQLDAARRAYEAGEGPGALRHLDGIMLQHGPAIEEAARQRPIIIEGVGGSASREVGTPRRPRKRPPKIEPPGVAEFRPPPREPNVVDAFDSYSAFLREQQAVARRNGISLYDMQKMHGIFNAEDFQRAKFERQQPQQPRAAGEGFTVAGEPPQPPPPRQGGLPAPSEPGGPGVMPPERGPSPAPPQRRAPLSATQPAWRRGEASLATSIATRERADALTRERFDVEENLFRGVDSKTRLAMMTAYQQGREAHIPPRFRDFFKQSERDFANQSFGENWQGIWYELRQNYWPSFVKPNEAFRASQAGKVDVRSAMRFGGPGARPGFTRPKVFDDFAELRAAGFEPVSTNPAVLKAMRIEAGNMAMNRINAVRAFIEDGLAIPAAERSRMSRQRRELYADWVQVRVAGQLFHMHPEAHKLLQYGLGVDRQSLLQFAGINEHSLTGRVGQGIASAWMTARNLAIPLKLALSAFHARHMLAIQRTQPLSAAMTEAFNGRITFSEFTRRLGDYNEMYAQLHGRRMLEIIKLPHENLSPQERVYKDLMLAGGFSPMRPSVYELNAQRTLRRLINDDLPRVYEKLSDKEISGLAAAWQVPALHAKKMLYYWMRGVEKLQEPLFQDWIPMIKAAAYVNQAKGIIAARPDLVRGGLAGSDELRQVLTQLRKSIDNRFGEMQYAKEFWHPTLKFGSFASFLSVGWNLGFAREFGGGLVRDPAKLLRFTREPVTGKRYWNPELTLRTAYSASYVMYGLILGGIMTTLFTGQKPQSVTDLVYPRLPDGERLTTQSFNREFGGAYYHLKEEGLLGLFELILNKTNSLFGSSLEAMRGRDYYGRQISDPNAGIGTRVLQTMGHIIKGSTVPISVTSVTDKNITDPALISLSLSGFNPAPKYVEKPGIVSTIQHAHRIQYPTYVIPWAEIEKRDELRAVRQHFDKFQKTRDPKEDQAWKKGLGDYVKKHPEIVGRNGQNINRMLRSWYGPEGATLFQRLDAATQIAILQKASPEDRTRYLPFAKPEVKVKMGQQPAQQRGISVDDLYRPQ